MNYQYLVLRDISTDTRKHMPDEDFAGKGRSFPIEKPEDVDAAVHSIGRAGDDNYDAPTLKANIKRIAKRKGFALPKEWQDDEKVAASEQADAFKASAEATKASAKAAKEDTAEMHTAAAAAHRGAADAHRKLGGTLMVKHHDEMAGYHDGKAEALCDGGGGVTMTMTERGPRFAVLIGSLRDGAKRIPIAILGSFQKGAQKFAITRATLAEIVRNFRARQADTVIDYEHASEFPEAAAGGPIPASGWLKAIDDAPDDHGILWGKAEFTPRASELIKNREYKYLSPVIDYDARDKVTGKPQGATLLSVALTNRPFLEAMPAIAMSDWRKGSRGDAVGRKEVMKKVILADRVAGTVKLVADDGTESVVACEGMPKVITLSDVKRGQDGRYDFAGLPQEGETLVASDVVRAMTVDREVEAAVQAGKVTPAQRPHFEKLALSDLAGFREIVKSMPVQVNLRETGVGGTGAELDEFGQAKRAVDEAIGKLRATDKTLSYGQAWKMIDPALVRRYNESAKKRGAA